MHDDASGFCAETRSAQCEAASAVNMIARRLMARTTFACLKPSSTSMARLEHEHVYNITCTLACLAVSVASCLEQSLACHIACLICLPIVLNQRRCERTEHETQYGRRCGGSIEGLQVPSGMVRHPSIPQLQAPRCEWFSSCCALGPVR